MVEIAMVGSAVLYICRIFLNSDSVMTDHAGRFFRPKYSLGDWNKDELDFQAFTRQFLTQNNTLPQT